MTVERKSAKGRREVQSRESVSEAKRGTHGSEQWDVLREAEAGLSVPRERAVSSLSRRSDVRCRGPWSGKSSSVSTRHLGGTMFCQDPCKKTPFHKDLGRERPSSGEFPKRPVRTTLAQVWPSSAQVGTGSGKLGPKSTVVTPRFGQVWPRRLLALLPTLVPLLESVDLHPSSLLAAPDSAGSAA